MNDRQLELFLKAAECGNFARAERELFLSRQAIMKQINRMEAELDMKLFVRTSAGLALTPAGDMLRIGVAPIRREMERLLDACRRWRRRAQGSALRFPAIRRRCSTNRFRSSGSVFHMCGWTSSARRRRAACNACRKGKSTWQRCPTGKSWKAPG